MTNDAAVAPMTDIDVPDWVVEASARAVAANAGEDYDSIGQFAQEVLKSTQYEALRAALSAWVVPELFVSRDGIYAVRDARRRDVMAYTKAWNDAISSQMVPLYTLRQEKPE